MAIRVAMLSFWHVHAADYARQARQHPETEIVAVWDELADRGAARAAEFGARFSPDLDELLTSPDIDAVVVDTPTNVHRDVMVAAAQAGKHIFTEKVLALTTRECDEILAAVAAAGVRLTVSLPRLYHGYTLAVRELLDRGALGDVTLVRVRLAHGGALPTADNPDGWLPAHFYDLQQCGGGALVDLGCHPMYLSRLFLGAMPETVSASYGYVTGRDVEDNAVAVLQRPGGALAVVEAGFANKHSPFSIEVHGTEGSVCFGTPGPGLQARGANVSPAAADAWTDIALPADAPMAFDQWVTHIQQGTTATENIAMAADLTALMEAANLSHQHGRPVAIADLPR